MVEPGDDDLVARADRPRERAGEVEQQRRRVGAEHDLPRIYADEIGPGAPRRGPPLPPGPRSRRRPRPCSRCHAGSGRRRPRSPCRAPVSRRERRRRPRSCRPARGRGQGTARGTRRGLAMSVMGIPWLAEAVLGNSGPPALPAVALACPFVARRRRGRPARAPSWPDGRPELHGAVQLPPEGVGGQRLGASPKVEVEQHADEGAERRHDDLGDRGEDPRDEPVVADGGTDRADDALRSPPR